SRSSASGSAAGARCRARSRAACCPPSASAARGPSARRCAASAGASRRGRPRPRSCTGAGRPSAEQLLPRVRLVCLAQALERLALGLRQLRGHLDAEPREQVAAPVALQLRRAATLDAEELAV